VITFNAQRKGAPDRDPRIAHIDEWQRISERKRDDVLGINFFEGVKQFYQLGDLAVGPRYRPAVRIPELQVMMMREANDLSEFQPQAYIYGQKNDERLSNVEKGFKAQWNGMMVPYHLLFGFVQSQFYGTGFLQAGIDPMANNGRGKMWTKCRDPKTVHMDPATDYTLNWSYIILEDYVHLDEIKRRFPERARFLPKYPGNTTGDLRASDSQSGFRMPDGPFQSMPAFDNVSTQRGLTSRLRYCLCRDYTRELIPAATPIGTPANPIGPLPVNPQAPPQYRWTYPNGRMMVDCEGVVLADGQIPWPQGRFNLIPIWATPPLFGPWAVPPTRFSDSLQSLAEKMYSQTFENFYRLNNGVWLIPESAEISQSDFGGVAGEKQTYKGEKPPNLVTPPQFPDSSLKFPEAILQKQRDLHGFTQARQGNPGDGNLSPELFDAAVLRGQGMTQLRGRLASASVFELAKSIGYAMIAFMPDQKMPLKENANKFEVVDYKRPEESIDDINMMLDDGSFHVKSQAIVARIAEQLMQKGALPVGEGLAMLGYPDAEGIGKRIDENRALAAVAAVGQPRGGKA
jgi:hypothetical protein